ncbi:adrenodoxin-like [Clupea harengus]|uniref:Adrenodoxin-like n=1 Tax=Clupea harengus TaxID=7950 RepID=A0A6P3VQP3_CLUHA|nr:adrenodoxin-like [Clupea harengus]
MAKHVCLQSVLSVRSVRLWNALSGFQSRSDRLQFQLLQRRQISRQAQLFTGSQNDSSLNTKILVHFINQDGVKNSVTVSEGETLLDVVINKNLDISGFGACEGTLACSTCHLVFEENIYNRLDPVVDEEVDMLDLAYGVSNTSRLGCQVTVESWMDGMTVCVPQEVKDQRELSKRTK